MYIVEKLRDSVTVVDKSDAWVQEPSLTFIVKSKIQMPRFTTQVRIPFCFEPKLTFNFIFS